MTSSSTVTSMPDRSGMTISGRTSTSAVNLSGSPSPKSVISTSGRPSVLTSCSRTAARMFSGIASWTASLRTVPRPTRWSITEDGTLPLRKPGITI
jgi:hypothetical protein